MHIGVVSPCSSGPLVDLLPDSDGADIGCGVPQQAPLIRALVNRGHVLSIVTLSSAISEPKVLKGRNIVFYCFPMRRYRRMRDLYKLERLGLLEGIRLANPDVLHAHWTYEFALASLDSGLPTVVTCRDNALQILRYKPDLYRLGRLGLQIAVLRRANIVTAVSPYLADSLRWLAKAKITVVANCVESHHRGHRRRQESGSVKIATVLNGWQRRKNPKTALKAFALLRKVVPAARLFMFGQDFENGGIAARWAAANKMDTNVHFCGPLPHQELQNRLAEMLVLLHPALEESFGMAIVEAMAQGLPVVAGKNAGGVPWLLDEGRTGYLTDVKSPEAIRDALVLAMTDEKLREEKRRNAYEHIQRNFSPDAVAERYEKIYEHALAGRASFGLEVVA